jgi:ribosome-binding protein aMBF1 (putative translation factor)
MTKFNTEGRQKVRLIPADEVFAKARRNPAYRAAYDALEEEFALVASVIEARTRSKLTQAELAKRMGTTQAVVARLESGRAMPSTRTLERFAKATGTKLRITFEPVKQGKAR